MSKVYTKESKVSQSKTALIRMYNVGQYYNILQKVGRGTYGSVYKAKGLKDGRFYAIKKMENNDVKLQQQGFPITALRGTYLIVSEITLLKQIDHPNIIKLKEIIVSKPNKRNLFRGSTFLVFEYMDHDFAGLFKHKIKFSLSEIKSIIKQLIEGVSYLHRNKIFHRDIKSANILLNDEGDVKLADFGLGRKVRFENYYTYKVVTLWYRAPELLLGCKTYSDKIDVWSIGCVVAQFFTGQVLFRKETQYAQMQRIYEVVGDFQANGMQITEESYKTYQNLQDLRPRKSHPKDLTNYLKKHHSAITDITLDFIERLLHFDPSKRLSCQQALRHPFFSQKPLACHKSQIQKMDYECHQMFRDRSIKIDRIVAKRDPNLQKKEFKPKDYREQRKKYIHNIDHQKQPFERREKPIQQRKYLRQSKQPQFRNKQPRNRDDRYFDYQRKGQKRKSSIYSSPSERSETPNSSSVSSNYSSQERSQSRRRSRSRYDSHHRRDDQRHREQYMRREDRRKVERRLQKGQYDKHYRRHRDDERYYKRDSVERRRDYVYQRKKHESGERRKDYREEPPYRKDEKRYQRRDDKGSFELRENRKPQYIRKDEKRDDRKQFRRQGVVIDNKQRRFEKGGSRYDSKDNQQQRYGSKDHQGYDKQREYGRKQERWDQKVRDKYVDYQKQRGEYGRRDEVNSDKRNDKYYFVSGKNNFRKNETNSISSEGSQNHYKKDRHKQPYHYQRKPYSYKYQEHDHRNH